MSNDQEIIASINALLVQDDHAGLEIGDRSKHETRSRHRNQSLVTIDQSFILAVGHGRAMALDGHGKVIGVKLSNVGQLGAEIFSEICKLKHLERLVFYANHPIEIPPTIAELRKLKLLWLGGDIKSLPREILTLPLPSHVGEENTPPETLSRQGKKAVGVSYKPGSRRGERDNCPKRRCRKLTGIE